MRSHAYTCWRTGPPWAAVERGTIKCAPYFAEAPRTAKALGRFTVQTADVEEVGVPPALRADYLRTDEARTAPPCVV